MQYTCDTAMDSDMNFSSSVFLQHVFCCAGFGISDGINHIEIHPSPLKVSVARSDHGGFLLPVQIPCLCATKELQMQHCESLSLQLLLGCLRRAKGMWD